MTQAQFPEIIVRDYGSLVDALRAAKEHRQISFELMDGLAGLCSGHSEKLLGIGQQKRIGPVVLGLILGALGVRLRIEPDPDAKMAHRWDQRDLRQVRERRTVSQAALDRCRPIILRELTRNATIARQQQAKARRARNHNGHNGHARP